MSKKIINIAGFNLLKGTHILVSLIKDFLFAQSDVIFLYCHTDASGSSYVSITSLVTLALAPEMPSKHSMDFADHTRAAKAPSTANQPTGDGSSCPRDAARNDSKNLADYTRSTRLPFQQPQSGMNKPP